MSIAIRAGTLGPAPFAAFNPTFRVGGIDVVLHPLEIVSVPLDRLGAPVGSLANDVANIQHQKHQKCGGR
jgi:toxin CcdB